MGSENKSTMCYSNIAEYSVRYVDYRTWYNSDAHARNTQQQRSGLPTHLRQCSRTRCNSDAHEAIHPPTMYYSRGANDLQQ